PGPRRVGKAAPEIHDSFAVDVHASCGANITPFLKILRKRVLHGGETCVTETLRPGCRGHPAPLKASNLLNHSCREVPCYLRPYRNALPELLGKRNDDALWAADVTEPVHVFILGYFAYELSAMGAQAREHILNVVDGEHDATDAQRIHWCVLRL